MAEAQVDIMSVVDKVIGNIVTVTGLNAALVYTVPDENEPPKVKKNVQIVTMALTSFVPDVGQQTGGAAYQQTFNQTWRTVFVINVWSVYMVDEVGQNNQWLRNATRGIIPLWMKVFKALEQYMPTDGTGAVMLEQPMRLSPGGFQFVPMPQTTLGRIRAEFEASFIPILPT